MENNNNEAQSPSGQSLPVHSELEEAQKKLLQREQNHQRMKQANKLIKINGPELIEELKKLGIRDDKIARILNPRYSYERKGFPSYELTNNGSEIRRLTARVETLKLKAEKSQTQDGKTEEINGVIITHNYTEDRIQLDFGKKPERGILIELHRRGFHCTHEKIWQRKITDSAQYDARHIAGMKK
ncbi:hypothetical protein PV783_13715 [Chitinophaga sp. CC14]|uniref:hypothetical protein n=1 Tax=Chitinophaga sp. CC14 TaxID=3029199 RepID=UPI003B76E267